MNSKKRFAFWILGTLLASAAHEAQAVILWAGGEDIDFPNGAPACATATAGKFRAGYARYGVQPCTSMLMLKSTTFSGGAVTSAWLTYRLGYGYNATMNRDIGFGKSGTSSGLFVGADTTAKHTLWKYDGTTWTVLATESGNTFGQCTLPKYDIQVISYGVAGTVNVYASGSGCSTSQTVPIITYTGDLTVAGMTNFDSVFAVIQTTWNQAVSEIIVSSTDTRALSLVTLAPSAAGDLNAWTGGDYTNVDDNVANDLAPISSNVSADKFQCNLNDLPAGVSLSVLAVKVSARASTGGTGMTSLSVGVKTNATVNAPGAAVQSGAFTSTETYYSTNPVTTNPWTTTEMNNLQINLQSAP